MPEDRLIIFGGSGFVGGQLAALALLQGWNVIVADTSHHAGLGHAKWRQVDITNPESVNNLIGDTNPSAVVNLAAMADIDRCEREKDLAWQINVQGASSVAKSCAHFGIRHLYFSSDAVFNGRNGPYKEQDPPDPLNYYGKTKAEAEEVILSTHLGAVVIRISLVLGFPLTAGNSFLSSLSNKLNAGAEIFCPMDEIRTPVDVYTLCQCVLELITGSYAGLLHIGCNQGASRYELTRLAALRLGYPTSLVRPQSAPSDTGRAPRHKNGLLDISKALKTLRTPLLTLDETIERAIIRDK
jgi:dTDP-4-dehydrorhamnose reductase